MDSDQTAPLTPDEVREALKIAAELIAAGIPVFSAAPNLERPGEYHLPPKWQLTVPSMVWLEKWQPGWALAAVGGHAADFLDVDPRNGGEASRRELEQQRQFPRSFGRQATPSGGTHDIISATGERKATMFMPGVDLQSGASDGQGRGFVWISPTVRPSKDVADNGALRPYRWTVRPDMDLLEEWRGTDDSTEGIIARVYSARAASKVREPSGSAPTLSSEPFATSSEISAYVGNPAGERRFTLAEAQEWCRPHLTRLQEAPIGQIEERCNVAAATLSHFVPAIWSAERAMEILRTCLASTAYDPDHPASTWTADKFMPVLDGRRPPLDPWKAVLRAEEPLPAPGALAEAAPPLEDAVSALIAEMLSPEQIALHDPPRSLIKGLLTLDSESWLIGEPGSKKSFVALDMAAHVATGRTWQGLKVHQTRVVMIVAEGAGGSGLRVRAWEKIHGPMGAEIFILPRPVQAMNITAWSVLVEACRRLAPGMVVIDTQARVTVGLEENSAKEMGIYVEAVRAIREATGACVLTVHHTGRKGGDARGSSAIDGAQSTELKVVVKEGLRGELRTEKQKDLEQAAPMPLVFERVTVGQDEDDLPITSLVLTSDPYRMAEAGGPEAPEPWEAGHAAVIVQLFKVLRDQGGALGLTKAEARLAVIERFYSKDPKRLNKSTWYTGWDRASARVGASGDPVMVNVNGQRWTVDTVALETLVGDRPGDVS